MKQFLLEMFASHLSLDVIDGVIARADGNIDVAVQRCIEIEQSKGDDDGNAEEEEEEEEANISLVPASQGEPPQHIEEAVSDAGRSPVEDQIDLTLDVAIGTDVSPSPWSASIARLRQLLTADSTPPTTVLVSFRTLHHAISNVLVHPTVDKYRMLPLANDKFRSKLCGESHQPALVLGEASVLLQSIGFETISAGPKEEFLLLTDQTRYQTLLTQAAKEIEETIEHLNQCMPGASTPASQPLIFVPAAPVPVSHPPPHAAASHSADPSSSAPSSSSSSSSGLSSDQLLYTPLSELKRMIHHKRPAAASHANMRTSKLTREQMAERVEARIKGKNEATDNTKDAQPDSMSNGDAPAAAAAAGAGASPGVRCGRQSSLTHLASLRNQIASVRRAHHQRRSMTSGRKRMFSIADLAGMQSEELKIRSQFMAGTGAADTGKGNGGSKFRTLADFEVGSPADCVRMGKEMLRLTNLFRASEGKAALQWHQAIHDIGLVHSKNMALKLVPFGHDGASGRFASYPFPSRSAAENVAWSSGHSDVAKCHVDGWIKSPGHRANMLAHHTWCAIAVFRNTQGAYYSTQLFGLG